jgi:hypothetical protein
MTEIQKKPDNAAATPMDEAGRQWRYASALAKATIIPKAYQGNPANVFVALSTAAQLGVGPLEVMQNLHVIHGSPSFSSKYCIAMANRNGPFDGPIKFDIQHAPLPSVTAYATVKGSGERVEFKVDMEMATKEGWTKNSKYKTMPTLMLSYRAATLLIRLYCPEVLLGLQTAEELHDVRAARTVIPTALEQEQELHAQGQGVEQVAAPRADADAAPPHAEAVAKPDAKEGDGDHDLF